MKPGEKAARHMVGNSKRKNLPRDLRGWPHCLSWGGGCFALALSPTHCYHEVPTASTQSFLEASSHPRNIWSVEGQAKSPPPHAAQAFPQLALPFETHELFERFCSLSGLLEFLLLRVSLTRGHISGLRTTSIW